MFPVPPELELEYVVATMSRIKNLQFLTMERRWNKSIIFVKEKISVRDVLILNSYSLKKII
jgi:superfamily II DNA/RNA helicase